MAALHELAQLAEMRHHEIRRGFVKLGCVIVAGEYPYAPYAGAVCSVHIVLHVADKCCVLCAEPVLLHEAVYMGFFI